MYSMVHGYGDTAADQYAVALQAYNSAVAVRNAALGKQAAQDAAYDDALRSYSMKKQAIDSNYASQMPGYNAAMAAWKAKQSSYQATQSAINAKLAAWSSASASVERSTGVSPPAGYQGCLTASDQAKYLAACNASTVVRGVDGLGWVRVPELPSLFGLGASSKPECAWAKLPVCQPLPPLPPSPGPQPTPPKKAAYPKAPVKPPAVYVPPDPGAPPTPPTTAATPPRALAVGGLLALVLIGGGATYYLTTRKKKAA